MSADAHANPHLAHHFEDVQQQQETHTLGMWVFLATEIMFFGGLFLAFIVYHVMYPEAFIAASERLNVWYGGVNTFFLILSSLTMALAVHGAQLGNQKNIKKYLIFTIVLACAFLVVKSFEWHEKYVHHTIPGTQFNFAYSVFHELPATASAEQIAHHSHEIEKYHAWKLQDPSLDRHAQLFYLLYFIMTGLHGIHVVIGIGVLIWIYLRARKREFHEHWNTPVELTGLYWHFVDLVWIYLFPVIYLIHRH